ncbi:MAG: glutathione S-transferase family protein [Aromatoleum sp.]|jgi:glutathione S-transferase|uniref:glutathione S-transferase family protein n=1 Tax=Aromatoleum sp. TaxID=2307007 RepID=UPI0028938596|nr:glutathione S-transferase family protein [Aromatoleum sp.]MDT3671614.1 glutathione S-transferase family protein [Aromatoleum sp.]
MALRFYHGGGSPYSWRVWLALEHKGIPYEQKVLSFDAGDLKKPEYLAINPRGKVPAIVDDGVSLYESAAILEYLDERYDEPPLLFPGDIGRRALIRRMVREADQYAADALEKFVAEILYTEQARWRPEPIMDARDEFIGELDRWESTIHGDTLAGELSAADFTLYPIIALALRIEKRKPDLGLRERIGPKTAAWMTRIEGLPYFARTWPSHWT